MKANGYTSFLYSEGVVCKIAFAPSGPCGRVQKWAGLGVQCAKMGGTRRSAVRRVVPCAMNGRRGSALQLGGVQCAK